MFIELKKIIFGKFITFVSIVLISSFNIVLLFLPLTNVFGFEFSFINAILISFLSGLIIISYLKKNELITYKIITHKNSLFIIAKIGIILLIIPLIISITNSFLTQFCSFKDGLLFYLVLTVPSYIIGITLGIIAYSITKKLTLLVYLIIFLLIFLYCPFIT